MKNYIFFLFFILLFISCKKNDDYAVLGTTVQAAPIVGKTLSALEVAGFKQITLNVVGGEWNFYKKVGIQRSFGLHGGYLFCPHECRVRFY